MPKVLSGWKRVHTKTQKGKLAHYKETVTYGSGVIADCLFSEFGELYGLPGSTTNNVPVPPAGVDFTVMFIQNDTMSTAGDIVLMGAEEKSGTFAILKDNLIEVAANSTSTPVGTVAVYSQRAGVTPTGGRMPVFKFFQDDDAVHSTSTGTDKTAEIHIFWEIP